MFALPLNENTAYVVESIGGGQEFEEDGTPVDETWEPKTWKHFTVTFEPKLRTDCFETHSGSGVVHAATPNPQNSAIWMLARNQLYLVSRKSREIVQAVLPEDRLTIYNVNEVHGRYYLSCSRGRIWYYDSEKSKWISLLKADPRPEREPYLPKETAEEYVKRTTPKTKEYVRKFPNFFCSFGSDDEHYFLGGLGRVVRHKKGKLDEFRLDSGVQLINGFSEGGQVVLCGNAPIAEIYVGSFDNGFERIFQSDEKSLHMTSVYNGIRYIGASVYPGTEGPSLFTLDGGEISPIETGCAREPQNLICLVSTGNVLWAIDEIGFFRLTSEGWQLTEFLEIQNASRPT